MTALKHILVPVLTLDADRASLETASELAAKFQARCTALLVSVAIGSEFAHTHAPLSDLLADIAAGSRSQAALEREKIQKWLDGAPHDFDVHEITIELAVGDDQVVAHARYADLIVLGRAHEHARARRELLEDVVFKSGRVVLLLPGRPTTPAWERVLIAWNASAEAMRAIIGAMPFLKAASEVRIVTVDASPERDGAAPGVELAAYLARHGVRAEVSNLDGLGRDASRAITDAATDFSAGLIVMGAYGHSRAREFVLGGVSRDLLGYCATPLLLAH